MIARIAAISLLATGAFAFAAPAVSFAEGASLQSVDTDHDGTIDMAEAKKAAMEKFSTADTDHDGTLDSKEAGMNVGQADPDKDGTLDKSEYETALASTFKATDTDHDGTVDAKELASPEGQKLDAMMK